MLAADFSFGPYALDLAAGRLLRHGEPLTVSGSGIRILEALLEAGGGVVTKEFLLERGWPGTIVEEGNLSVQIAKLRDLLQNGAERGEWIVTVPRVGYRLLRQDKVAAGPASAAPSVKPSIAVLPFDNLGGADAPDFGADGLVEDLITGLSRFRTFAVISRNSAFVYKGRAVDARQAASELGVRYLLEGSVRRAGDRVRITAQLIEGATGVHLWAEKLDGQLGDIFEFQDRITASVIGLIEPQIQQAEIERSRQKRPDSFDAWDLYVQAVPLVLSAKVSDYDVAIALLHRALALEPNYCPALAMASWAHERRWTFGGIASAAVDDVQIAFALAHRAVETGPNDALALANLGWQRILFKGDFSGLDLCERAVSLNPYHRSVLELAAVAHLFAGDLDKLILYATRALDLSPGAPDNYECANHVASGHFQAGRFSEAVSWAQRSIDLEPGYFFAHVHLAAALAHLGRVDEAARAYATARLINPNLSLASDGPANRFPDRHARWVEAARLLGAVS
jgi:TolB-like protein